MAKVGKETYRRVGYGDNVEYGIFYTKKDGFFAKPPEDVLKIKPKQIVYGDSYEDAKIKMDKYLRDFYATQVTVTKVIAYYIGYCLPAEVAGMRSQYSEQYEHRNAEHPVFGSKNPGQQLKIDYKVLWKVENHDKTLVMEKEPRDGNFDKALFYRCSRPGDRWGGYGTKADYNEWDLLPYTPELEEWFSSTVSAAQQLILKVYQFFGGNNQHLLENLEKNGGMKLIENKETE